MVAQLAHRFTLRHHAEFSTDTCVQAEQVHGHLVVSVGKDHLGQIIPAADALITNQYQVTLSVRTADCGPVFFYDPVQKAIGLAHSGKKGTEQNITGAVISGLTTQFGSKAADLIVVLGPCIRPPNYEVDFAVEIGRQAKAAGVINYHDCGLNTAANLEQFYSYRMEQGRTGRHYSFLMLN